MAFNSIAYLFAFLPLVVLLTRTLDQGASRRSARVFVIVATSAFYALAGPRLLPLLLVSVATNYFVGLAIERSAARARLQQAAVVLGVCANLAYLAYFKYAGFLVTNWDALTGTMHHFRQLVLPVGISFYTFQQIGYLVDVKREKTPAGGPLAYANFVLFFPQLLAGPIVQYSEVVPQFEAPPKPGQAGSDILIGLATFSIGLFKKTVVADTAALYATPVYGAADAGTPLGMLDGWIGIFAYTVQIYFDFSGYSDMAIGSARMLGILLPLNFYSPLRSATTLEFWRRWHITLGRWVRSYIFQPLAVPMNRLAANAGAGKWGTFLLGVMVPTMVTMLVLGIWHGAAWNFAVFGLLQGIYMSVNEAWALFRKKARRAKKGQVLAWHRPLAVTGTVLAFTVSNVAFGTTDLDAMIRLFGALGGGGGALVIQPAWPLGMSGALAVLVPVYAAIYLVPNTQQILGRFEPVLDWQRWFDPADGRWLRWRPTPGWAFATGCVLFLGIAFISRGVVKFVYFNF